MLALGGGPWGKVGRGNSLNQRNGMGESLWRGPAGSKDPFWPPKPLPREVSSRQASVCHTPGSSGLILATSSVWPIQCHLPCSAGTPKRLGIGQIQVSGMPEAFVGRLLLRAFLAGISNYLNDLGKSDPCRGRSPASSPRHLWSPHGA